MRGLCLGVLFFTLTGTSLARAEEPLPLDLDWKAPDECASESTLRAELARVARVRPGRVVSRLSARGRIEKQGESYRLTLKTGQGTEAGVRTLVATECRSLAREVTLVLAVAFGEGVELVEPSTSTDGATGTSATTGTTNPVTEATPAPPAAPPTAPPPAPKPAPPAAKKPEASSSPDAPTQNGGKPSRFRAAFVAGGGLLLRALPAPAAFATAGVELGNRRFWVAPRFVWVPGVDDTLPRNVEARYRGLGGALAGCTGWPAAVFVIGGCAGAQVIALHGQSTGATDSGAAVAPWYAGTATLFAEVPSRGKFGVRLEAQLDVSLTTPHFDVEGLGEAHRVPRLGGNLSAVFVIAPWL